MGNYDFGNFLTRLRREKGVTQAQLADALGLTNKAVSKWETGEAYPETGQLVPLANYFGVTTDELLRGRRDGEESGDPGQETRQDAAEPETPRARGFHYEYKSKRTFCGLPLVHINFGTLSYGRSRAKGIVAVGNVATGLVSVGLASAGLVSAGLAGVGLLSFGLVALGLISFACFAFGVLAVGAVAVGLFAVGGVAVGMISVGGVAVGNWALGGLAIGRDIAVGGRAYGFVAIGTRAFGEHVLSCPADVDDFLSYFDSETVREFIFTHLPGAPRFIVRFLTLGF